MLKQLNFNKLNKRSIAKRFSKSRGFALITSLLLLLLLSGIAVGTIYMVTSERTVNGNDLQDTQAYYGAEAAMEKMMGDLNGLYSGEASPTSSEITGLSAYPPSISGITYNTYTLTFISSGNVPTITDSTISSGAFAGLIAELVPITLSVDAQASSGADVSMIRHVDVALIPVFQFGVFSDGDLSYYPGALYNMTGRVHTNSNLYLATLNNSWNLIFHSKMTTAGEVIRLGLPNGYSISSGSGYYNGSNVLIPTTTSGCDGTLPASTCRAMTLTDEGSIEGGIGSALNPNWVNLSTNTYNSMIINYKSGVHSLNLPIVTDGYRPIELLRQPWTGETQCTGQPPSGCAFITQSRLYSISQIRVLINDSNASGTFPTPGTPVRLANVSPYVGGTTTAPTYGGTAAAGPCVTSNTTTPATYCGTAFAEGMTQISSNVLPAASAGSASNNCLAQLTTGSWPAGCIYEPGLGPTPYSGAAYAYTSGCTPSTVKGADPYGGTSVATCGTQCWKTPSGKQNTACNGIFGSGKTNYAARQDFVLPGNAVQSSPSCILLSSNFITSYPNTTGTGMVSDNAWCWPLIDGYILIQARQSDGSYTDVTQEWLGYGIGQSDPVDSANSTVVDANAILSFQRYADIDGDGNVDVCTSWVATNPNPCNQTALTGSATGTSAPFNPNFSATGYTQTYCVSGSTAAGCTSATPTAVGTKLAYINGDPRKYYPLQMYDTREGESRPGGKLGGTTAGSSNFYYKATQGGAGQAGSFSISNGTSMSYAYQPNAVSTGCGINGIINIVELNVYNLQRWLYGTIGNSPATSGSTGTTVESTSQNGYIFYFSDRRGMNPDPNAPNFPVGTGTGSRLTGAYGFEDVFNPSSSYGSPNGVLDAGEDSNQNNMLDTFGQSNIYKGFSATQFTDSTSSTGLPDPFQPVVCGPSSPTSSSPYVAWKNKVSGARHALRLVNGGFVGGTTALPGNRVTSGGTTNTYGGFTVASENPVYVLGQYNASSSVSFGDPSCSTATTGCHVGAAVMADAVILLSNQWSDLNSFNSPNTASGRDTPQATYYRLAIVQGKNPTATYSAFSNLGGGSYCGPNGAGGVNCPEFGTDGGSSNFLRFLEYWNNASVYYDGSMVSLFYGEYFTSSYKPAVCCSDVYGAPTRTYAFDTDFQTIALLPPGTPRLRDVENTGFQQLFTPY